MQTIYSYFLTFILHTFFHLPLLSSLFTLHLLSSLLLQLFGNLLTFFMYLLCPVSATLYFLTALEQIAADDSDFPNTEKILHADYFTFFFSFISSLSFLQLLLGPSSIDFYTPFYLTIKGKVVIRMNQNLILRIVDDVTANSLIKFVYFQISLLFWLSMTFDPFNLLLLILLLHSLCLNEIVVGVVRNMTKKNKQ